MNCFQVLLSNSACAATSWDFDVLVLSSEELRAYVLLMFGSLALLRAAAPGQADAAAPETMDTAVGPAGYCPPPCHPTHVEPSFIEILVSQDVASNILPAASSNAC